jgi:opacity protein-like surface antigen
MDRPVVFQQKQQTFAAAAALLCLAARAQADPDWMLGAYMGGAWTSSADVTTTSSGGRLVLPDITFRSESLESPIYYGYRVGRRIAQAPLFVEGELIHLKVVANEDSLAPPLEALAMTHGMNFILANAVWMPSLASERVRVTIRGGAGITVPHAETRIHGEERGDYQFASVGWQVASGLAVHIAGPWYVNAEYKFTAARPEVDTADGSLSVPVRTHHWVFGVSAMF